MQIERTIKILTTVDSGDLEVVMNDQPVPKQFLPELSLTLNVDETFEIVDRYVKAKGEMTGYPLVREITEAAHRAQFEMDMGDYDGGESGEWTVDGSSPIEGSAFEIGRDGDDGIVAAWIDPETSPDEALLEHLRPEIDVAGLLPEKPVEIGASWEADAAALAELLEPSGNLSWKWDGNGADYMPGPSETDHSGVLELRLAEMLDGDIARIVMTGELVVVETSESTLEEVPVVDGTATDVTTTKYAARGELRWNVRAGVLHSLELECEGQGDQVTTKDPDQDGPSYESTMSSEGTLKVTVECRLAVD
jgi:hypothetical protein